MPPVARSTKRSSDSGPDRRWDLILAVIGALLSAVFTPFFDFDLYSKDAEGRSEATKTVIINNWSIDGWILITVGVVGLIAIIGYVGSLLGAASDLADAADAADITADIVDVDIDDLY